MNNSLFLKGTDIPRFRDFLNLMKEKRLKSRIETTIINRNLRKNGARPLLLEELYTIRELAVDLECNYNSLRKFISGNGGNLKFDILGRLENLKKENSTDERRVGLINIDVTPCKNCGGLHTHLCKNKIIPLALQAYGDTIEDLKNREKNTLLYIGEGIKCPGY